MKIFKQKLWLFLAMFVSVSTAVHSAEGMSMYGWIRNELKGLYRALFTASVYKSESQKIDIIWKALLINVNGNYESRYNNVKELLQQGYNLNQDTDWISLILAQVYSYHAHINVIGIQPVPLHTEYLCKLLRLFLQYNAKITASALASAAGLDNKEMAEILIKEYIVRLAAEHTKREEYKNSIDESTIQPEGNSVLDTLPPEALDSIVKRLPMSDIGSFSQTDKKRRNWIYDYRYDKEAPDYFSQKLIELLYTPNSKGKSPLSIMEGNVGIGFSDLADQLKSDVTRKEYIKKVLQ